MIDKVLTITGNILNKVFSHSKAFAEYCWEVEESRCWNSWAQYRDCLVCESGYKSCTQWTGNGWAC